MNETAEHTKPSNSSNKIEKYMLKPSFLQLLQSVSAIEAISTLSEVLECMKNYIISRKLFDPDNPRTIYCENDTLGEVLGVKKFTISDVMGLLKLVVFPLPTTPIKNDTTAMPNKNGSVNEIIDKDTLKRKLELDSDEDDKRPCLEGKQNSNSVSAIYIYIPATPEYDSTAETDISIQGYETAIVKDTSDDLWYLDEDEYQAEEDQFSIEYEPWSDSSKKDSSDSDTNSDVEDIIQTILICKDDNDMEFWADNSSDDDSSDPELTDADKWTCKQCGSLNRPPTRFCQHCWEERIGWLPENNRHRHPPINRRKRKPQERKIDSISKNQKEDSNLELPSTSQETSEIPNLETASDSHNVGETRNCDPDLTDSYECTNLIKESSSVTNLNQMNITDSFIESTHKEIETHVTNNPSTDTFQVSEECGDFNNEHMSSKKETECAGDPSFKCNLQTNSSSHQNKEPSVNPSSSSSTESSNNLCPLCLCRQKTAIIIHGKTGHQICCYPCARHLEKKGKPCPVCRRVIQRVIRNFYV